MDEENNAGVLLRAILELIDRRRSLAELREMTPQELNSYLENIARLIEATAGNAEDAARIVRDSKVKA